LICIKIKNIMNRFINIIVITLILTSNLFSQSIAGKVTDSETGEPLDGYVFSPIPIVFGKVTDSETGEPLPYCNISISGTYRGTTSNLDGIYKLKLHSGKYALLFQYMGYKSETVEIELVLQNLLLDIKLHPQVLPMNAITVYANQKSEAELLILKASKRKRKSLQFIKDYSCNSYTKTSYKSSVKKTAYGGIFETFSELYFNAPNKWHKVLLSQRQTANIPKSVNYVSSNTFLDINADKIHLGKKTIVGPTAPDAIAYYSYEILDTLYQDNNRIFKIKFSPKNENLPAMSGELYLVDKYFIINHIDAALNEECNYDVFENIHIIQRYKALNDSIYLPNYSLRESNFVIDIPGFPTLLMKKENFRENCIVNSDKNKIAPDDKTVEIRNTISFDSIPMHIPPLTVDEKNGYSKLDSIVHHNKKLYFFTRLVKLINYYAFLKSQPIGDFSDFFHFNRVEGIFGGASIDTKEYLEFISLKAGYGYGTQDEKSKYYICPSLRFKNRKIALKFTFGYYNRLEKREQTEEYPIWLNSFESIFNNFDYFDYYYTKGNTIDLDFKFGRLQFNTSYINEKHSSAYKNINYALFKQNQFIDNPAILAGRFVGPSIKVKYSNIAYLESSLSKRLIPNQNFTELDFSVDAGLKNWGSDVDFYKYQLMLFFRKNTYYKGFFDISFLIGTSTGNLPLQKYFEVESGFSGYERFKAFSTLDQNTYIGTNKFALYIEHNFHNSIFRLSRIPLINKIPWELSLIYNTGWAGNKKINKLIFDDFYSEAGFGLNKIFNLLKFEFIWRTKYIENSSNFSFNLKVDDFDIF